MWFAIEGIHFLRFSNSFFWHAFGAFWQSTSQNAKHQINGRLWATPLYVAFHGWGAICCQLTNSNTVLLHTFENAVKSLTFHDHTVTYSRKGKKKKIKKEKQCMKQGPPPLEAILVIFGRRALIFFV